MGAITNRIKQAIIDLAETLSDYAKIGYGNPAGTAIQIEGAGTYPRGMVWREDRGFEEGMLDFLVKKFGAEHDRAAVAHCLVSTNATLVAPTFTQNTGFSDVEKNEGTDTLTLTPDPVYTGANNYQVFASIDGTFSSYRVDSYTPDVFTIKFATPWTGATIDINSLSVRILVVGLQ